MSATVEVEVKEILLYGRVYSPESIPSDVITRCAYCDLVDPTHRGHNRDDCNLALREEVKKLRAIVIPLQDTRS